VISRIKNTVQNYAARLGYRIVPRNRDAQTLLRYAESFPISAVVDVGANVGLTCLHWLQTFPSAHVHAIEALERFRPDLEKTAAAFPGRMSIWPFAATDHAGELKFRVHEDHPSSSSLLASTDESHELLPFTKNNNEIAVQAVRIDDLFANAGIDLGKNILLKLDVQGAELSVLRGCEAFLSQVDCVLCEVNLRLLYEGQAELVDIIAHLRRFGLEFSGVAEQYHAEDGRAIYLDAVFLRSSLGAMSTT
jgi:FkbM family methyltransferase